MSGFCRVGKRSAAHQTCGKERSVGGAALAHPTKTLEARTSSVPAFVALHRDRKNKRPEANRMALRSQGDYRYGDNQSDLRDEIARYSGVNGYPAQHYADAACRCGTRVFRLFFDDNEGAAVRR